MKRYFHIWKFFLSERKIRDNKDKQNITSLCVFDFDGTLFKSPQKPEDEGNSWWLHRKSLDVPNTPSSPGREWWYNKTVAKTKDPSCYTIMLTGRSDRYLEERINELLLQRKLVFDEVGLNDAGLESEDFKIARINEIVKSLPNLKEIEMWEDKEDLARKYQKEYGNGPYKFKINIVDESYSKAPKNKIVVRIKK